MQNYTTNDILFEGAANKQWQVKGINLPGNKGGKLILTKNELIFEAHALNFGNKRDVIPLADITCINKDIHVLTPSPNMISVTTRLGEKHMFIVRGKDRDTWLRVLSDAVGNCTKEIQHEQTDGGETICASCGYRSKQQFKFCPECGSPSL